MLDKGENDMKRVAFWFMLMLVGTLVLGACSSDSADKESNKEKNNKEVVATVNGENIASEEYQKELEATKAMYTQQGVDFKEIDGEMKKQVEQSVLDQLINTKLVLQSAENDGISVGQKEIDAEIGNVKGQFEDDKQYQAALKENKITEEELTQQVRQQLIITQYLDKNIGDVKVSEDEVKLVYDQYKEQAESMKQEVKDFETMKPELEQQAIAQKKNEEVSKHIEDLRAKNEKNIEILL
nr:SurA N-terminal domain-containing protein [Mesobacillus campisalis]